jgi:hypothetical protein
MASFDIRLVMTREAGGRPESEGVISLEDQRERFVASHEVWSWDDYVSQWADAARRLIAGHPACFVTDLASASGDREYRGERWNAWPRGDVIEFQHQLLVGDDPDFDAHDPCASVSPAPVTTNSDGVTPSTWYVPRVEIHSWLERTMAIGSGGGVSGEGRAE